VLDLGDADATCTFDYDGLGSIDTGKFEGKIGGTRFTSVATMQSSTTEVHGVALDLATFASTVAFPANPFPPKAMADLQLAAGGAAVDKGVLLAGVNDGFTGPAPDLGAYELGVALPVYGPRPSGAGGATGTGGAIGIDGGSPGTGGMVGIDGGAGGVPGTGGRPGSGGALGTDAGAGGVPGTGGRPGSGGALGTDAGAGGVPGTGGRTGSGGAAGTTSAGGVTGAGGVSPSGGADASATGGVSGGGGNAPDAGAGTGKGSGCGCTTAGSSSDHGLVAFALITLASLWASRRRRARFP
jgi:MYXO-CTERM domain-containing protein